MCPGASGNFSVEGIGYLHHKIQLVFTVQLHRFDYRQIQYKSDDRLIWLQVV